MNSTIIGQIMPPQEIRSRPIISLDDAAEEIGIPAAKILKLKWSLSLKVKIIGQTIYIYKDDLEKIKAKAGKSKP